MHAIIISIIQMRKLSLQGMSCFPKVIQILTVELGSQFQQFCSRGHTAEASDAPFKPCLGLERMSSLVDQSRPAPVATVPLLETIWHILFALVSH